MRSFVGEVIQPKQFLQQVSQPCLGCAISCSLVVRITTEQRLTRSPTLVKTCPHFFIAHVRKLRKSRRSKLPRELARMATLRCARRHVRVGLLVNIYSVVLPTRAICLATTLLSQVTTGMLRKVQLKTCNIEICCATIKLHKCVVIDTSWISFNAHETRKQWLQVEVDNEIVIFCYLSYPASISSHSCYWSKFGKN